MQNHNNLFNKSLSKICLGTEIYSRKHNNISFKEIESIFFKSRDFGINFIDCAECYGNHLSETIIGEIIYKNRNSWIVASKFGHYNNSKRLENKFDLKSVKKQLEKSLTSLKIDCIDIYYFHSGNDDDFFNDDLWNYLNTQVKLGKIKYLGLSLKHDLVKNNYLDQAKKASKYNIKFIQTVYNYLNTDSDKFLFDICNENNIEIITRMPLAKGILSGYYKNNQDFLPEDDRLKFKKINDLYFKRIKNELSHIPRDKLASWSLNWVLENKNVKSSVMAFRNTNQLENIIHNANWK